MPEKILIIEDDPNIGELVRMHLQYSGFQVELYTDGISGLERFWETAFDLLIVDIMLPRLEGLEIIKKIRLKNRFMPILITTAKADLVNKVLGFELGADDYLTKPFSIEELIVRVKALLRRAASPSPDKPESEKQIIIHDVKVDLYRRKTFVKDIEIELSPKLFDLLVFLMNNPGRPFSRSELLGHVWEYDHEGYDHTVDTHINRLRAKIEPKPSKPKYILTVWGVGYKFVEPTEFGK
jgi:two-component system, OmpR family, response regulator